MRVLAAGLAPALVAGLIATLPHRAGADPSLAEREALIEKALEARPEDPELHLQRALVQRARASWDAAGASYLRAAALGADRDQTAVALAQVFLEAGFPRTAEMQLQSVLERKPEDVDARITRARVLGVLGKSEAAADDFQRGVALLARPDPGLVREAMDAQLAAGRSEQALQVADAAMQKIGTVVSVQLPAIEIEQQLGRSDAALARIDALLVQAPRHETWIARRGEILERAGRVDEARATYEYALALIQERPAKRRSEKIAQLERRLRSKLGKRKPEDESRP